MRNPIRLKNLRGRFLPFFVLAALALAFLRPTPLGFAVGGALVGAGAALRSWGAGHLVKNDELTVTGPYAYLRHPLYAGSLLIGIGFSLIAGGWVAALLLVLLVPWFFLRYFPRKDRIESDRLEALYGEAYAAYRKAVPPLLPTGSAWRPPVAAGAAPSQEHFDGQRWLDNNELGTLLAVAAGMLLFGVRALLALP